MISKQCSFLFLFHPVDFFNIVCYYVPLPNSGSRVRMQETRKEEEEEKKMCIGKLDSAVPTPECTSLSLSLSTLVPLFYKVLRRAWIKWSGGIWGGLR